MSEIPKKKSEKPAKDAEIKVELKSTDDENIFDVVAKDSDLKKSVSITAEQIKASPQMQAYQQAFEIAKDKIAINQKFINQILEKGQPDSRINPRQYKLLEAYKVEKQTWENEIANIKLNIARQLLTQTLFK